MPLTKDEMLEAATEFARRVLSEAMCDTVTEIDATKVCEWGRECGLILSRRLGRAEARDFGVDPGTEIWDFENWLESAVADV